mgnify:CR=1 FL=1
MDDEAVGEECFDHVVDVAFEVVGALFSACEGHVEHYVAGTLMSQSELQAVVLH